MQYIILLGIIAIKITSRTIEHHIIIFSYGIIHIVAEIPHTVIVVEEISSRSCIGRIVKSRSRRSENRPAGGRCE